MSLTLRSIPRPVEALVAEATAAGVQVIGPQRGPQERFLASPATVAIFGGAAGGGKSFALQLDALRYAALSPMPGYRAVIFRRVMPQITLPGGLWDESQSLYNLAKGKANQGRHEWSWPGYNTQIKFASMQYEANRFAWQGSQLGYIAFDELTHFTEEQVFYMFSRKRSKSGAPTRIRGTTNPDADSWVKRFLAPWVDENYDGVKAKSGEIRWFIRDGGVIHWLLPGERHPDGISVTFIAASLFDNPALLSADPSYLSSLKALPLVERQRLLYGDWSARNTGTLFKRHWFPLIEPDQAPSPTEIARIVRYWDLAATEPSETSPDPDWTAGVKVARLHNDSYVILDYRRTRANPLQVEELVRHTAEDDGHATAIYMEQEPGASGKNGIDYYRRKVLAGFTFQGIKTTGNKELRANPVSSQAQGKNIAILRIAPWYDILLSELEAFPTPGVHDDGPDALFGAMEQLFARSAQHHVDYAKKYAEMRGR